MASRAVRSLTWLEGVGLHTGDSSAACIEPAPQGHGLVFVRADLDPQVTIRATPGHVVATDRSTVLGQGVVTVRTVEHVLAALAGLDIWDATIYVDGPELPALDGSALPFVEHIRSKGPWAPAPPALELTRTLEVRQGRSMARATPAPRLSVGCQIRFDHPAIGAQKAGWRGSPKTFAKTIAGARTFGLLSEVEDLWSRELARGGSLDNALVFGPDGPLRPQRMAREPARHKLLDAIGDLALLGRPLAARISLTMAGHETVVALARIAHQPSSRIG